jgi:hypothetical protein
MKPALRQIQIAPFQFRQYSVWFRVVTLKFKMLNRTAVVLTYT